MDEQHSGCYRDVPMAPVDVVGSVASWIGREYGDRYRVGYVGVFPYSDSTPQTTEYVFQVRAGDGSRFLVACSTWGVPFHCKGSGWLAYAQTAGVEAYV